MVKKYMHNIKCIIKLGYSIACKKCSSSLLGKVLGSCKIENIQSIDLNLVMQFSLDYTSATRIDVILCFASNDTNAVEFSMEKFFMFVITLNTYFELYYILAASKFQ